MWPPPSILRYWGKPVRKLYYSYSGQSWRLTSLIKSSTANLDGIVSALSTGVFRAVVVETYILSSLTLQGWRGRPIRLKALESPDRQMQFGVWHWLLVESLGLSSPPVRRFQVDFSSLPVVFWGEKHAQGIGLYRVLAIGKRALGAISRR